MALSFNCEHCGEAIVVRYLGPGEEAHCRACGHEQAVPEDAAEATEAEVDASLAAGPRPPQPPADRQDPKHVGDPFLKAPPRYLAPLWKRLLGYVVDGLVVGIPAFIMIMPAVRRIAGMEPGEGAVLELMPFMPEYWMLQLLQFGVLLIQAVLLVERGQTIGKALLNTRIVTLKDGHPAWWRLLLLRPLIPLLVTFRPDLQYPDEVWSLPARMVLGALGLADALSIFGIERRTLHDRLAGTRVIDLGLLRRSPDVDRI